MTKGDASMLSTATLIGVKITSADIGTVLSRLENSAITLYDIRMHDELSVTVYFKACEYRFAVDVLDHCACEYQVLNSNDYARFQRIFSRPVLWVSVLILLACALVLPTRVLFIQVDGGVHIPANLIIEQAQSAGVYFGARAKGVHSEAVKNYLLEQIPQLQWVGVTIKGCVATIVVEEKQDVGYAHEVKTDYSSIVSSENSVITEATATSGNLLCQVGDTVQKGQVLISPYTDCGTVIKVENAAGEIYGHTQHSISAVTPNVYQKRALYQVVENRIYLIIGKKLINFMKGSGISTSSCVKMYSYTYAKLPGGFKLPLIIVRETICSCLELRNCVEDINSDWLANYAKTHMLSQMVCGQILRENIHMHDDNGLVRLRGNYLCTEMIGRRRTEQVIQGE